MSNDMKKSHEYDFLKELIEKKEHREAKAAQMVRDARKNQSTKDSFKKKAMLTLYAIGALAGVGMIANYTYEQIEQKMIASEQQQVHRLIKQANPEIAKNIRQKYDVELLMLINEYQTGVKLNGFKMSPYNAVFLAHSDLLSKYNAYNPNVQDENHSLEDWILFDHMCYRYYQFRQMKLSKRRDDFSNAYADKVREDFIMPTKRIPVRYGDFFDGLKLHNIMAR